MSAKSPTVTSPTAMPITYQAGRCESRSLTGNGYPRPGRQQSSGGNGRGPRVVGQPRRERADDARIELRARAEPQLGKGLDAALGLGPVRPRGDHRVEG